MTPSEFYKRNRIALSIAMLNLLASLICFFIAIPNAATLTLVALSAWLILSFSFTLIFAIAMSGQYKPAKVEQRPTPMPCEIYTAVVSFIFNGYWRVEYFRTYKIAKAYAQCLKDAGYTPIFIDYTKYVYDIDEPNTPAQKHTVTNFI